MVKQEAIINEIRQLKQNLLPGSRLVLFGSQARKDASNNSDWDMLLLLDKAKITHSDFDTYAYPFVELGWKLGEYFSMKVYSLSEWQTRSHSLFYKNVEQDGIEL